MPFTLFQYHSKCGQPRRGSGPSVQGLGSGGGGGGQEEYTVSLGQFRLPFRPRLLTSSLQAGSQYQPACCMLGANALHTMLQGSACTASNQEQIPLAAKGLHSGASWSACL